MKTRWENLSLREQQTLSLGSIFLLILFIYFLIWMPLANHVSALRAQIKQNQVLLTWMKSADQQIRLNQGKFRQQAKEGGSILSQTQALLNLSPIAQSLTQMRQAEHNSVQLSFTQVNFDLLIDWIVQVGEQQGWVVSKISIKPAGTLGMTSADIIIGPLE